MKRTFLVSWQSGNSPMRLMIVEAEFHWEAEEIAREYLDKERGYPNPNVIVHDFLIKGEYGVQNLS